MCGGLKKTSLDLKGLRKIRNFSRNKVRNLLGDDLHFLFIDIVKWTLVFAMSSLSIFGQSVKCVFSSQMDFSVSFEVVLCEPERCSYVLDRRKKLQK